MRRLILETPRLQLCEMVLDDFKSLSLILQDENVMHAYNGAFSEEETMAWLQKQFRRYKEFGFGLWGVFRVSPKTRLYSFL